VNIAKTDEEKAHILHVDDEPQIRLLMAGSLQEFGYAVRTAGTVAEALQLAEEIRFDVCILDVGLPDGTGIDLCRRLRKLQPAVLVVYYSGYADHAAWKKALSAGGDAYLTKPISAAELEKAVAGILKRKRAERSPAQV